MRNVRVGPTLPLLAALAITLAAAPVRADESPLGMGCADRLSSDSVVYTFCAGKVSSFDGVPLDVDLTVPQGRFADRLPLLVMLHGWSRSKTAFESETTGGVAGHPETIGYNNVAFANRGYAVLTFTARGFYGSCGLSSDPGALDPAGPCARGWTHVGDRRWEIHDLKHLAGLLADAGVADAARIGVTGFSFGGWETMLAAIEGDVVTAPDGTIAPWRSASGLAMHLAAAVAQPGISDVVSLFVPNGRASDGVIIPDADRRRPLGIVRQTVLVGFPALPFVETANEPITAVPRYAPAGVDPEADFLSWIALLEAGEPRPSTAVAHVVEELARWRSAYWQTDLMARDAEAGDEVPLLLLAGWTDDVHASSDSTSLAARLRAADPDWPVSVLVGDIGDPRTQSKPAEWAEANAQATTFLDHYLRGVGPRPLRSFAARVTNCGSDPGTLVSADSWESLATGRVTFESTSAAQMTTSAIGDPVSGVASEPAVAVVAQSAGAPPACIRLPKGSEPPQPASAIWQWPVESAFTMLGMPVVSLNLEVAGTDAEVNTRLWDVGNDGTRTLVDRGVYRYLGREAAATIRYALFGNGWAWRPGDVVELEVTQVDAPFLRPDDVPSVVVYKAAKLTLPVLQWGATALPSR